MQKPILLIGILSMMGTNARNAQTDVRAEDAVINFGEIIKECREMDITHQRELAIRELEKIEASIDPSRGTVRIKKYLQALVAHLKTLRP